MKVIKNIFDINSIAIFAHNFSHNKNKVFIYEQIK